MFSATRYLVAGVIVALFGGFLLVDVGQPWQSERLPDVIDASPLASPVETTTRPTIVPATPPEATEVGDGDKLVDLLPGVDLIVEVVGSGVYRVLGDGVRNLRSKVWDVAVDDLGRVWVKSHRLDHWGPPGADPTDPFFTDHRVVQLGAQGSGFRNERIRGVAQLADGSVQVSMESRKPRYLDDERWRPVSPIADPCAVPENPWLGTSVIASDGTCWTTTNPPASHDERDRWLQVEPGGGVTVHLGSEVLAGSVARVFDEIALGGDGDVWVLGETNGTPSQLTLARFDGEDWHPSTPFDKRPDYGVIDTAVAPDGSAWIALASRTGSSVAALRWDGSAWTELGPIDVTAIDRDRHDTDGFIWFDESDRAWLGGLTVADGSRLRHIGVPGSEAAANVSVSATSRAPDGSVWVILTSEVPPADPTCTPHCYRARVAEGLYVIRPEQALAEDA